MKRNLFYLLPLLLTLGVACSPKSDVTPIPQPQGNFKGVFAAVLKKSTGGYDTIRDTNFRVALTASSRFVVQAETPHHVASFGAFAYNSLYIQFVDSNTVASGNGAKFHLKDVYQYGYDGSNLVLQRLGSGDTVRIQYGLKKIN
ncbi:hypothetical protein [Mucilaginibacter celer]|uniref:Uncharacterized protein n=1 Tax=Mucilaginibacter celer TaxID=2305508 RepID=A0A494W0H0_9SPHI|nr:hypothetical protein [Mucilaginibacter celer]AYL96985.1 hypothetical protein HYN43_017460 [Mucilaginibacter celer]